MKQTKSLRSVPVLQLLITLISASQSSKAILTRTSSNNDSAPSVSITFATSLSRSLMLAYTGTLMKADRLLLRACYLLHTLHGAPDIFLLIPAHACTSQTETDPSIDTLGGDPTGWPWLQNTLNALTSASNIKSGNKGMGVGGVFSRFACDARRSRKVG